MKHLYQIWRKTPNANKDNPNRLFETWETPYNARERFAFLRGYYREHEWYLRKVKA